VTLNGRTVSREDPKKEAVYERLLKKTNMLKSWGKGGVRLKEKSCLPAARKSRKGGGEEK